MLLGSNLDKYQKAAVITEKKNVLVVAAPGSGKTTTIVNRTAYLINEKKVNPNNIIVITFTRAAAKNMQARYLKINSGRKSPFFGTFHGLFYKIIRRINSEFKIIERWQAYNVIKSVLTTYLDDVSEDKIKEVLNCISLFKTSLMKLEEFSPDIDKNIFTDCFEKYESFKKKNNLKDFDDLQLECKKLFVENPNILNGYRRLFKHILVDEFQDCDSLQIEILKLLVKESYLFAVGDEDQCIYGFRGSRPDCMVDFKKHFNHGEKIFLSNNYRNPQNIVSSALKLIENNNMRNRKEIHPVKTNESKIKIRNLLNETAQAEEIANNIIKFKEVINYNFEDNAILYRTNVESRSIIDIFIRKRIPFKMMDREYNFFEHFICRDILAYLKLSMDSSDKESFLRIINKPFRYISKVYLDKIRRNIIKDDCFDMLKSFENIHPFQMKTIDKLKKDIQSLNKYSLRSAIERVLTDLGYYDYIREYCGKYKLDVSEMEEIIDEFREASTEYKSIITFLVHVDEVKEQIENNKKNSEVNRDAVILSTIHGVKGMEFKNVFIINCNEENIPHSNSLENNIEEERRLFYVAVTRTIENLWIGISRNIKGKTKETSRFVRELMPVSYEENNNLFKKGEMILHKSFGIGKVLYIDEKNIDIVFNNGITRKFDVIITLNNNLISKTEEH